MAAHTKEKILCRCSQCGGEKFLPPSLAKSFSFCSNECKWTASKSILRYNKLPEFQYVPIQCHNELCNKTFKVLPCHSKRRKYCCRDCKFKAESLEYPALLAIKKREEDLKYKKRIWFV